MNSVYVLICFIEFRQNPNKRGKLKVGNLIETIQRVLLRIFVFF